MQLTNSAIGRIQPGEALSDSLVPGLRVRANKNGKSFYLRYRTQSGQHRQPKLGSCAIMTLGQARDAARAMLLDVATGHDPAESRRNARQEPSLNELWDRVAKEHYNQGRTWDEEAAQMYRRCIEPVIGTLRVSQLRYADVERVRNAGASAPIQTNRALAVLSVMLNLAERWELRPIGSNPCQRIPRYPQTARKRFATAADLSKIGPILQAETAAHPEGVAFLYLMLFSGARPSEIARVTWAQLESRLDGTGVLRIPDGKTGHRDVYLPKQAMSVIHQLPPGLPTARITGLSGIPKRLWNRIREAAGCPDLWVRDFRRTFATVGLSSGVPISMIGELLGHRSTQTTKIYAKLMDDPAVQAASQIAESMERLLTA